jgi:hypothetical protein
MVSRNPCSAGPNGRWRMAPSAMMLTATFMEMMSTSRSRIVRATNGSSMHCPAKPRLVWSSPTVRATIAGQVQVGVRAPAQWLMELP